MSRKNFPFQNYSLINFRREVWKDIPGFEGIYQISDYGRVKSLSRKVSMNSPNGGMYTSKEKIRKAGFDIKYNKTIGQSLYSLVITLYKDGITYNFSVARLVYYAFKEKFDLQDSSIYITYKDHDGRNVHITNLVKSDRVTMKLLSYKEGRAVSHLKVLSKPVTQFDSKGNPLNSFPSMYEAGKILSINPSAIAEVASGKCHLYKGFFWKRGNITRKLNLKKISRTIPREPVHRNLMKRLKLRKVDLNSPAPFLNLSTQSMKGEIWKDVPEYEGLYMISNFGRVKALQKITYGKQKKWMPEQIQRLTVDFRIDGSGKEVPGSALVSMARNGKKRIVSVSRLVYYLFVKKFDIADTTHRIYYKDGNTLNLNSDNLILKSGAWSINKMLEPK